MAPWRPAGILAGLLLAAAPAKLQAQEAAQPFLHHWRATLGYGNTAGGLNDDPGTRIGFARSQQVAAGLEAGIGRYGFGRIEAGGARQESKREYPDDDLDGDSDSRFVGASGGVFLTPFMAAGLAVQYRRHAGKDEFVNRAGAGSVIYDVDGSSWRTAPFILLTAPAGPVNLSLLGIYARTRGYSDYESSLLPGEVTREKSQTDLRMAEFSASIRPVPRWRLAAGIAWMQVLHQRIVASGLPLDDDWGRLSLDAGWDAGGGFELRAGASHDVENARGSSFGWTLGLAYRF